MAYDAHDGIIYLQMGIGQAAYNLASLLDGRDHWVDLNAASAVAQEAGATLNTSDFQNTYVEVVLGSIGTV